MKYTISTNDFKEPSSWGTALAALKQFIDDLEQIRDEYVTLHDISKLERKLEDNGLTPEEAQMVVHDDLMGGDNKDVIIH